MSKELINFDTFNNDFGTVLAENEMFQENTKHGKKCIAELKDRLIEHVSFFNSFNFFFFLLIIFNVSSSEYTHHCHVLFPFAFETYE